MGLNLQNPNDYLYLIFACFIMLQGVGFSFYSILLLLKFLKEISIFKVISNKSSAGGQPEGISVLVSLKGNTQVVGLGLTNLVHQDYVGPIELIFITETSKDPAVESVSRLLANEKSKVEVRWVFDEPLIGANPRTAKMLLGLQRARHPWIYWTSPDTVVEKDHLRKMMEMSAGDQKKFVTSMPLQSGASNLGALLENVSFIWGIISFFLMNRLMGKAQVYGGSILFHKNLLTDTKSIANYLTEEVPMTDIFVKNGGQCLVIPQFAKVIQKEQSIKELYERNVRWMMIVKYHHRSVYFACIANSFVWLLVLWLVTGQIFYGSLALIFLLSKMVANLIYHIMLNMTFRQTLGSLLIPFYEFFTIVFIFHSLFKKTVDWRGDIMEIDSQGVLTRRN